MAMSDRRRGLSKQLKKDQAVRREVFDEIGSETVQEHTEPRVPATRTETRRAVTGTVRAGTPTRTAAAIRASLVTMA